MGAQGSGKGTQASLLGPALNLVRIATGDMFRAEIASGSALGVQLNAILERGDLVPNDLTNALVRARVSALVEQRSSGDGVAGALFDGFPRTEDQARALDDILQSFNESVTVVIEIDVPRAVLIERLSGRRVCDGCGAVYHAASNPPVVNGTCDACGGRVIQRDDDKPEAIKRRLALFDEQTAPLIDFYDAQGKLVRVNGDRAIDVVNAEILEIVRHRRTGSVVR